MKRDRRFLASFEDLLVEESFTVEELAKRSAQLEETGQKLRQLLEETQIRKTLVDAKLASMINPRKRA
jgi:hypothetical protein